jgi:hypothetical protein
VLDVALQIGDGLAAIHAAGILHRDLKPNNILFDADDRPRIADLGLACRLDDADALAENVGTGQYMAPEALRGKSRTQRDDLYAYCLVVFEMFYGHPPFASIEARLRGEVSDIRRPDGMSATLRRVLIRGLHPDPERRWPNMHELLCAMRGTLAPRRPWGWVAAGVSAALALGSFLSMRTAEADTCEQIEDELAQIWNDEIRRDLQSALGTRMAGDNLQSWANRWVAVRARECDAAERGDGDQDSTPCSVKMRERFGATVEALRTSHLREGLRFANVIAELPAPEHCLDQPDDRDWGYGGLLELRDIDIEVEALVELGDLDVARARQVAYMDLAVDLRSEYGIARAMFFRAEIHRLEGSLDEATADFGRVYERAWELRVAELAAEVQIKLTAIAGARGDWGAVDAHAFDAEAILLEFRPERVAKLWQVQGLALVTGPEQARARGLALLQRAVEMREEQLREYGGTRQLLSEAHESYGRGLLAVGRAVEAVEYLDLALRVHEQEFGHGGWRTRGISMAKFTALIELRRFEDAAAVDRKILLASIHEENWARYTEDVLWMAENYAHAGNRDAAIWRLRTGRFEAVTRGLDTKDLDTMLQAIDGEM